MALEPDYPEAQKDFKSATARHRRAIAFTLAAFIEAFRGDDRGALSRSRPIMPMLIPRSVSCC
jgi:hypothetical protein